MLSPLVGDPRIETNRWRGDPLAGFPAISRTDFRLFVPRRRIDELGVGRVPAVEEEPIQF
jgi:hypothetical protein